MISRTMNILTALYLLLEINQFVAATSSSFLRNLSSNKCPISVSAYCYLDDSGSDCNTLKTSYTACEQQTTEMTLRFNGGECDQGYNSQSDELFQCFDKGGNSPSMDIDGSHTYVVVTNVNGDRITYFSQYVTVGEDFLIVDKEVANRLLDVDLNVTLYSSDELSADNILQTFVFHTSCKGSLFLNDFFGSTQVVGFKNDQQGMISNFVSATLNFDVKNEVDMPTDLSSFTIATGEEVDDIFSSIKGRETLQGGGTLSVTRQVYFDLGVSRFFSIQTRVGSTGNDDASPCEYDQDLEIIIGTPAGAEEIGFENFLPEDTQPPSAAPITAMPISPNDDEKCKLISSIVCEIKDDSSSSSSSSGCENLQAPVITECHGNVAPTKLTFKYTGQTCAESNHEPDFKDRFVCIDESAGIENAMKVFVSVNDEKPHQVPKNEEFTWVSNFGSYIHVTVAEDKDGSPGEELQNMKIGTRCREGDDLTLMKNYGALQLLGFENESQGIVDSFVEVEMTYSIENKGDTDAEDLKVVTRFSSETHELVAGAILRSGALNEYSQKERVSLIGSPSIRFGLEVTAITNPGTSNEGACAENNEFFVTVEQP